MPGEEAAQLRIAAESYEDLARLGREMAKLIEAQAETHRKLAAEYHKLSRLTEH